MQRNLSARLDALEQAQRERLTPLEHHEAPDPIRLVWIAAWGSARPHIVGHSAALPYVPGQAVDYRRGLLPPAEDDHADP